MDNYDSPLFIFKTAFGRQYSIIFTIYNIQLSAMETMWQN